MRILKSPDCEKTSPPSTCFVMFPDSESDLAFLAEIKDLPTANRTPEVMESSGVTDPEKITEIRQRGMTSRISFQSLFSHLQQSPNSSETYSEQIINASMEIFEMDRESILLKAFWMRTFWF